MESILKSQRLRSGNAARAKRSSTGLELVSDDNSSRTISRRPAVIGGSGAARVTAYQGSDSEHPSDAARVDRQGEDVGSALPFDEEAAVRIFKASPVVTSLEDLAREQEQQIQDIRETDYAVQRQLALLKAPGESGSSAPTSEGGSAPSPSAHEPTSLSEMACVRIESVAGRLSATKAKIEAVKDQIRLSLSPRGSFETIVKSGLSLEDAAAIVDGKAANDEEFEVLADRAGEETHSSRSHNSVRTSRALASQFEEDARATQIRALSKDAVKALKHPSNVQALRRREQESAHLYDPEERKAIRSGTDIGFEKRSPEEVHRRFCDKNGYLRNPRDPFVVGSSDESLGLSSDASTDDKSGTTLTDVDSSDQSSGEEETRKLVVQSVVAKAKAKSKPGEFVTYSCSSSALSALREDDVRIKLRTSRSHVVELVLNNWLRCNLAKFREAQMV